MNVPALRFPEFEGEWKEKKFSEFLVPNFRGVPKPNKNYLAIGIRSHGKGTFQKPDSDPQKIAMDTLYVVRENDLIVNITFAWEGAIAIVPKEDDGGHVSHRFPTYEFQKDLVSHEYFRSAIANRRFLQKLDLISPGGAGRNRVMSKPEFLKLRHTFPTLPEQKKIAAFLGVVDAKIAALRDRQAGLERYKRGLMQALFSQRLRFTRPDGSAFPDWEQKRLEEVANVNPTSEELPTKFSYIDLESVTNGVLGEVQEVEKASAPSRAQRILLQGDILFQTVRPYQRNNLYFDRRGPFVASTGYAQIRAGQNRQFLFQVLHTDSFVKMVLERCTGTSYPAISSNELAKIAIAMPHPDEQQKIADVLSVMDAKIQAVAGRVERMQTFKRGLLQQMFV